MPSDTLRTTGFLSDNFLLRSDRAAALYHDYAAPLPILDYHNHLSPRDIAVDRCFENLSEAWLEGDHYKWRAMRANGVAEHYITGGASHWEKFQQWAHTTPATLRNPLFHWTQLELRRYFNISELLQPQTAALIYEKAGDMLRRREFSARGLLQKMQVQWICSTDDPADDLAHHCFFTESCTAFRMTPCFRPDNAILIKKDSFPAYIETLSDAANVPIRSFADLVDALERRMDFFAGQGCRLSDHGLEHMYAADVTEATADRILQHRLEGKRLGSGEAELFQSALLSVIAQSYARRGWTQQFHLGALRNNSDRLSAAVGADAGADSIGDFPQARSLSRFLNKLDRRGELAQTILYNLNPADNELFATMAGNFNDGSVPGKIQWGSAWWFLDQKDGMENQINALSRLGLLSRFVGMLTDSRSFLSMPRHEYFRRILCNLLGSDMEAGELPDDLPMIGRLVQDVCYFNAQRYFKFNAA